MFCDIFCISLSISLIPVLQEACSATVLAGVLVLSLELFISSKKKAALRSLLFTLLMKAATLALVGEGRGGVVGVAKLLAKHGASFVVVVE